MARSPQIGTFCVSVDSGDSDAPSTELTHRRNQIAELLQQFQIPSNWTLGVSGSFLDLPVDGMLTARVPSSVSSRGEFVRTLRQFQAVLACKAQSVNSVAADPYQVKTYWDVLVRLGIRVARPRLSNPTRYVVPQGLRGGLWYIPVSCSFAGGSPQTVRSQLGICRSRLIETAHRRGVFHLSVNVENTRNSWAEEYEALRALLRAATEQHRLGALRFATLGELPALLANQRTGPGQRSILRKAA